MKNTDLIKLLQKFPPGMEVAVLDVRRHNEAPVNAPPAGLYPAFYVSQIGTSGKGRQAWLALEINDPELPEMEGLPELQVGQALNLALGLQIINRNKPADHTSYHVRAEHDVIYAGSLEWDLSDQDRAALERLGWTEDDDVDGWRYTV